MRTAKLSRTTKETDIVLSLNLDGSGNGTITTGVGFFDHMLTALALHGGVDLELSVKGDLEVDCHHTVEDTGIVLGQAFKAALGDRGGIARYGSAFVPMDEALGFCALDISGRPFLAFNADFTGPQVGGFDTQMAEEFFRAFAFGAGITLHLRVEYGKNDHHMLEALFKALGQSLRAAVRQQGGGVLSTKGMLD